MLVQSSGKLRVNDIQCCDTWLKLVQDSRWPGLERMLRENMLHKISAGRQEVGDNSFLRDFKTWMLSSRQAILQSMILHISSNRSPTELGVLVSSGEKTIGFLNWIYTIEKKRYTMICVIYLRSKHWPNQDEGRQDIRESCDCDMSHIRKTHSYLNLLKLT